MREALSRFRKAREACEPNSVALQTEDNCYLVANILDNAPAGFGVYRGTFEQSKTKAEYWSRIRLPEADVCRIDSKLTFYCIWPESDDAGTEVRSEEIVGALSACKNLGNPTITEAKYETPARRWWTLYVKFADRTNIMIIRSFWKPNEKQPTAKWELSLEIDAQVQQ